MAPVAALVLALGLAVLIGFGVVVGAPILAVPIVALVLATLGAAAVVRRARRPEDHARRAGLAPGADDVQFTERDRETLAPTPTEDERKANRRRAARARLGPERDS